MSEYELHVPAQILEKTEIPDGFLLRVKRQDKTCVDFFINPKYILFMDTNLRDNTVLIHMVYGGVIEVPMDEGNRILQWQERSGLIEEI